MKRILLILTAAALSAMATGCKLLDQDAWSLGTSYDPASGAVKVEIGKSPLPK